MSREERQPLIAEIDPEVAAELGILRRAR